MLTRIHVNQNVIKRNQKRGEREPPLTVKTYKENVKTDYVCIVDDHGKVVAQVVYRPDNPLPCGARVWIETKLQISVVPPPISSE